jgi:hypothetical protein
MVDFFNFMMLVCASVASMGFGILAAYWVLRVGFALMRPRSQRMGLKAQTEAARIS